MGNTNEPASPTLNIEQFVPYNLFDANLMNQLSLFYGSFQILQDSVTKNLIVKKTRVLES